MKRLKDKVIIVTGGAHGIGAAIVTRFIKEGAVVILGDVDHELGKIVSSNVGATFFPVDVSSITSVKRLVEQTMKQCGRLDCIVSNAGTHQGHKTVEEQKRQEWYHVLSVNLSATYYLAHFGAKYLRRQPGSSIIAIASVQGMRGFTRSSAYATSKGGLLSLVQQMATDLAPHIRVNAISPGSVRSYPEDITQEQEQKFGQLHLLKRIGEPSEIADGAVFLASEEASFITGHNLVIDGGLSCWGGH